MEKLVNSVNVIKEFVGEAGVMSVRIHQEYRNRNDSFITVAGVQVQSKIFKELVEDFNIPPCYVDYTERDSTEFPVELEVEKDGVHFYTIMDEHEYEMDFREWHTEEPNIDEEFIVEETPKGMTTTDVRMKEINVNPLRDWV